MFLYLTKKQGKTPIFEIFPFIRATQLWENGNRTYSNLISFLQGANQTAPFSILHTK